MVAVETVRRRLWAKAFVAVGAALGTFVSVAWFAWARPVVAETLTQRLGYEVKLGRLYPSWSQGGLTLVARDLVVMGRSPFHREPLALCDRVEIRPGTPPQISVDGLELRLLVAPAADNLRGAKTDKARGRPGLPKRTTIQALPLVNVRSGRILAQVALLGGQRMAVRVGETRFSNRGRAFDLHFGQVTAEVANMMTAHVASLDVETTPQGEVLLQGKSFDANLPGGAALFSGLAIEGTLHDEGWSLSAASSPQSEAQMQIHARRGVGGVSLQTQVQKWSLAALAPWLDAWGVGSHKGQARGSFDMHLEPGATAVSWQLQGQVRDLSLHHPALDRAVWDATSFAADAQGRFDWLEAKLEVSQAKLAPLGLPLEVSGWMNLGPHPRGRWSVRAPNEGWPCATLTQHVAPSVRRALWGLQMRGHLALAVDFSFDASDWDKLALDVRLPSTCEVTQEPHALALNLKALQAANAAIVDRPELPVASHHPGFTPFTKIPVHVIAAFLTAEDAGFFLHKGFEPDNIRRALIYNIERGRFVRGASTITQQVAKNVFLNHERTLTRKFVEAVLSWRLESLVAKRRLLEMYLNLVELGPDIRGVGAAAQAYFGKEIGALTPLEAAHLASLPPNPKGFARRFREGSVDEGWLARLYDLVAMMGRRGHLSSAQVAAARGTRLRLRKI